MDGSAAAKGRSRLPVPHPKSTTTGGDALVVSGRRPTTARAATRIARNDSTCNRLRRPRSVPPFVLLPAGSTEGAQFSQSTAPRAFAKSRSRQRLYRAPQPPRHRASSHHSRVSRFVDETLDAFSANRSEEASSKGSSKGSSARSASSGSSSQINMMQRKANEAAKLDEEARKEADETADLAEDAELPLRLSAGGTLRGPFWGTPGRLSNRTLFRNRTPSRGDRLSHAGYRLETRQYSHDAPDTPDRR
mmetsp:Transcript_5284/g.21336  ORF Transcript_5284/g.21336 Transcript_5284/m.21336 type:complete len:248 (-) Transcript_5284:914-1657(-)